jgi:hypothetical protein
MGVRYLTDVTEEVQMPHIVITLIIWLLAIG